MQTWSYSWNLISRPQHTNTQPTSSCTSSDSSSSSAAVVPVLSTSSAPSPSGTSLPSSFSSSPAVASSSSASDGSELRTVYVRMYLTQSWCMTFAASHGQYLQHRLAMLELLQHSPRLVQTSPESSNTTLMR